jgi:hypothetical protein
MVFVSHNATTRKAQLADAVDNAVLFASHGHGVFPLHSINAEGRCTCCRDCSSPGKHPLATIAPNGFKNATTDEEIIRGWFDLYPWVNYGVATKGLVVIDVDPRNGGDIRKLVTRTRALPHTWQVRTGGGGDHIIFAGSMDACSPVKGIDLKSHGGYIVGPGSLHKSGKRYHWHADSHPDNTALAPAPTWLIDLAQEPPTELDRRRSPEHWQRIAHEGACEGARNNTTASLCGHLLRAGIRADIVFELLVAWNASRNSPPLPEDEIENIVLSIAKKDRARRGQ